MRSRLRTLYRKACGRWIFVYMAGYTGYMTWTAFTGDADPWAVGIAIPCVFAATLFVGWGRYEQGREDQKEANPNVEEIPPHVADTLSRIEQRQAERLNTDSWMPSASSGVPPAATRSALDAFDADLRRALNRSDINRPGSEIQGYPPEWM